MPDNQDSTLANSLMGQVNPMQGVDTSLSNPVILQNMLLGLGRGFSPGPTYLPMSHAQILSNAVGGAMAGRNDVLNAYAQLPMYQAQVSQANAQTAQSQFAANLAQAKNAALAGAFSGQPQSQQGQSAPQMPQGGMPQGGSPQGGPPQGGPPQGMPSADGGTGAAMAMSPNNQGPQPTAQNNNTSQLSRPLTPIDMRTALAISSGNMTPPTTARDLSRLSSVFSFMGDAGNAKIFQNMSDKYQEQENKGFQFDPGSNSWVMNPTTQANMSRSANIQTLSTTAGQNGANYNPLTNTTSPVPGYQGVLAGNAAATSQGTTLGANSPAANAAKSQSAGMVAAATQSGDLTGKTFVNPQNPAQFAAPGQAHPQNWVPKEDLPPTSQMVVDTNKKAFDTAGTSYDEMQAHARNLDQLESIINNPNFAPGYVQAHLQEVKQAASSMGLLSDSLKASTDANQVFNAITTGTLFGQKNLENISRLTNFDISLFQKQVPQLENNPNAIRAMERLDRLSTTYEMGRLVAKRNALQNGTSTTDFDQQWQQAHPTTLPPEEQAGIQNMINPNNPTVPMFRNAQDLNSWAKVYGYTLGNRPDLKQSLLMQRRALMAPPQQGQPGGQ